MLINCVAYQDGAKLADIPVADISEYILRPGCFVWVALSDPSPEELDELQQEFGLHELAVEDASHGHQRPKIEEYGDSLFVVMQMVEPAAGEEHGLKRRRSGRLRGAQLCGLRAQQEHNASPNCCATVRASCCMR